MLFLIHYYTAYIYKILINITSSTIYVLQKNKITTFMNENMYD